MREMILARSPRGAVLRSPNSCRPSVRLHRAVRDQWRGLPVTIRLRSTRRCHEFLPHGEEVIAEVAAQHGRECGYGSAAASAALSEFNPMLGQRGARLLVSYPEIVEMQARAIFEAAIEAGKALHDRVIPEIMVPLVATKGELDLVKARIAGIARAVEKERGTNVAYSVGTMVELPRACLMAGEIGQSAEFFFSATTTTHHVGWPRDAGDSWRVCRQGDHTTIRS